MLYKYFKLDRFLRLYFADAQSWLSEWFVDSIETKEDQDDSDKLKQRLDEINREKTKLEWTIFRVDNVINTPSNDRNDQLKELQEDPQFKVYFDEIANIEENKNKEEEANLERIKENLNTQIQELVRESLRISSKLKSIDKDNSKDLDKTKLSPEVLNKLQSISNVDFLKVPTKKRLRYITNPNVDTESVKNWDIKNLNFNFIFNWELNRDLYMKTTAAQVLPAEVREVSSSGEIYTRLWVSGDFYNWSKRLTIHQDTNIQVLKLEWDLSGIETKSNGILKNFMEKNPEYNKDEFKWALQEAVYKWITWDKELKFLATMNRSNLDGLWKDELQKLLVVTTYLENAWQLDNYLNAWEAIRGIQEIISTLQKYWTKLNYTIEWNNIHFDLNSEWLPIWIEEMDSSLEKFVQVWLSQLWTHEKTWWADKYFRELWLNPNLNSRNTPWCRVYVNWMLAKAWFSGTAGKMSSREFIWEQWYGHVGIKVWNKLLWWNQSDQVSLINITKQPLGYAIPTKDWLQVHKPAWNVANIPDWAILVFGRNVSDKRYS